MKKFKLNIPLKKILPPLFLALVSSLILIVIFVASPSNEKYVQNVRYDLAEEPNVWHRDLQLTIAKETSEKDVDTVIRIIEKRLQLASIHSYEISKGKSEESWIVKVSLESNKPYDQLSKLISGKNDTEILTPKPGVNFEGEENMIAQYLPDNYDKKGWDRSRFRWITIKKLPVDASTYYYFTLFKPKTSAKEEFEKFLNDNISQKIGVYMDGYVQPYTVRAINDPITLAVASTEEEARIYSIFLNSGTFPVDVTITSTGTD